MRRFLRGFVFAVKGLIACAAGERNMRIHLCFAFYVLTLMPFYSFSRAEKLAVILAVGSVIAAEAFNTAIEALTDLVSPRYNELAKTAKDAAAGAVLAAAVFAAAVGVMLYFDIETIKQIVFRLSRNTGVLVAAIVTFIAWICFICAPLKGKDRRNKKEF